MKKSKTKVSTRPLIIDQSHLAWVLSLENWPLLESERERRGALSLIHFFHFHFHYFTLTFSLSLFFTSTFTILLSLFHFHSFTLNRKLATAREREKGCSFKVGQICSTTNAHLLLFAVRAKKGSGPNGTQKPFNLSTVPHWPILQFPHSHSHSTFPHYHSHSTFPHSHSHSHSTFPQRPILQWKSSIILIAHCLIGNLDFWWFLVFLQNTLWVSEFCTEHFLSFNWSIHRV